jgi:hypothetical protein
LSCRHPLRILLQFPDQARKALRPDPHLEGALLHVHPLDEELSDSRLLGGEQPIPQRLDGLVLFAEEMFESLHGRAKSIPVAVAKRRLRLHQGLSRPGQVIALLNHLRLGWPLVTLTEDDRQGLPERRFHGQSLAVAHDDALQLWDVRAYRDQVHRLNIQKGLFDRDHEEIASDHARAALVP